jgi:hypothetical protein
MNQHKKVPLRGGTGAAGINKPADVGGRPARPAWPSRDDLSKLTG